jgi:CBS domain-containing protein
LLLSHKIGSLPVVEKGTVIGIITTTDLLRAVLDDGHGAQQIVGSNGNST